MEYIITLPNVHNAIAGEAALKAAGKNVRVMALPSQIGQGCGLCLRLDPVEIQGGLLVLKNAAVEISGVYQASETPEGRVYTLWNL